MPVGWGIERQDGMPYSEPVCAAEEHNHRPKRLTAWLHRLPDLSPLRQHTASSSPLHPHLFHPCTGNWPPDSHKLVSGCMPHDFDRSMVPAAVEK